MFSFDKIIQEMLKIDCEMRKNRVNQDEYQGMSSTIDQVRPGRMYIELTTHLNILISLKHETITWKGSLIFTVRTCVCSTIQDTRDESLGLNQVILLR